MIRINLIAEKKAKAEGGGGAPGAPSATLPVIIVGLFAGLGALGCGAAYFYMSSQISAAEKDIVAKKDQLKKLEELKVKRDKLEQESKLLERKTTTIADLQGKQKISMRMLDQISSTLPDGLWLTDLSQTANTIALTGESVTETAVANFMQNLQKACPAQEGWTQKKDDECLPPRATPPPSPAPGPNKRPYFFFPTVDLVTPGIQEFMIGNTRLFRFKLQVSFQDPVSVWETEQKKLVKASPTPGAASPAPAPPK